MKLPKIDIIPGRSDDLVILALAAAAIIYVGTGDGAWSDSRWQRAGAGVGFAWGLLKTGKLVGEKEGWDKGYWTPNPAITPEERGGGLMGQVSGAVADRVVDMAIDQIQDIWPSDEEDRPKPSPPVEIQQQADPREMKQKAPRLPDGWRIDGRGRFRDGSGRVASDERRRRALRRD